MEENKEVENNVENNLQENVQPEENTEVTTEEVSTPVEEKHEESVQENNVPEKEEVAPVVSEPNKKKSNKTIILLIVLLLVVIGVVTFFAVKSMTGKKDNKESNKENVVENTTNENVEKPEKEYNSDYRLSGNGLEDFDLQFLKLENEEKNKIYSPLSIKYVLAMLKDGSDNDSKKQIEALIGDYQPKSYTNSENMSIANAFFIRDTFREYIDENYITDIKNKYNAEVIFDSFTSVDDMNAWVENKTFGLIKNLFDLEKVQNENFVLTNALVIDMNWVNQLQCAPNEVLPCKYYVVEYPHEKLQGEESEFKSYVSIIFNDNNYHALEFGNMNNAKSVEIKASFNRYDIINTLGEDNIREEVGKALNEWLKTEEGKGYENFEEYKNIDIFLDRYIKEIDENYKKEATSTDFMLYVDDNVKAFAKDLQEYDGTTLQYIGIMPTNESLTSYINKVKASDINTIISSLKEMKAENFKDGVVTLIEGYIPLFKYDFELKLIEDLQKLGMIDVFDLNKSDLSKMLKDDDNKQVIDEVKQKATIEFSNDGIKAAAATIGGGAGNVGGGFNYLFEVPYEKIDITFDKPYMYIIRDKATGEVWFTGTVYEPLTK